METFEVIHPYEATVAAVHAAKRDPAFWQSKYEALGQRGVEVLECGELDGERFRIRTRREVPAQVPGFAKKILAPFNTVEQTDTWAPDDGSAERHGEWQVEVIGRPIALRGIMRLVPLEPGRCHELIRGEAEVSVRVVGGLIARFVAGDTQRSLEREHAFTQTFLDK